MATSKTSKTSKSATDNTTDNTADDSGERLALLQHLYVIFCGVIGEACDIDQNLPGDAISLTTWLDCVAAVRNAVCARYAEDCSLFDITSLHNFQTIRQAHTYLYSRQITLCHLTDAALQNA